MSQTEPPKVVGDRRSKRGENIDEVVSVGEFLVKSRINSYLGPADEVPLFQSEESHIFLP